MREVDGDVEEGGRPAGSPGSPLRVTDSRSWDGLTEHLPRDGTCYAPGRMPGQMMALRRAAHAGYKWAGWIRLRRLVASSSPPYRVELGAGPIQREGWIPTDVAPTARYHLDATGPWPFPRGSVSHVYGDNMIEHVPLDGARALLRQAMEAMRPGARIRLVTPDVERCAEVYLERGDLAEAQLDAHRGAGTRVEHFVDILRGVFIEYDHYRGYAWDFQSLAAELQAAGFVSVERCELERSADPALCGLESRVLPIDRVTMLAIEAERP
jgi:predicted SAM-dependent methyltransferase